MEQLNKVQLRGNIGSVRIQNVGNSNVTKITVATNLAYRGQDGCCVIETGTISSLWKARAFMTSANWEEETESKS